MARYRIYPEKNSVIFEDDTDLNVGTNEVFELWYGENGVTRSVLKWNWSGYNALFAANLAPAITASTVDSIDFVFTCTYPILESGSSVGDAAYVLSLIDDGIYDFEEGIGWYHSGASALDGFANWLSANTVTAWAEPGAAGGGDSASASTTTARDGTEIRFVCDSAGEKAYIWNTYIRDNDTLLCMLRFSDAYEALTAATPTQKRLFYSRHTNTVFKPYIEIDWNDHISEDRTNVIEGLTSSLYLFVYSGGTLADPVSVDSVEILGQTYTAITKVAAGIYRYDYELPVGSGGTGTVINDTWNITYVGSLTGAIVQSFTGVAIGSSSLWSGGTAVRAQKYTVSMPNLVDEYTRNDRLYLRVLFRPELTSVYSVLKDAEFRIHIPDPNSGEPLLEMYPWTPISYSKENFFMLYLDWFLVGKTYQIDIRYSDGHAVVIDRTERKFKVIA